MSKSVFVDFREQGFWAFDVVVSVFLKHLVEVAAAHTSPGKDWLDQIIERWRVCTVMPDCFGFELDSSWSAGEVKEVCELVDRTCTQIALRSAISGAEIESWKLLDGMTLSARGLETVPTATIVRLGQGVKALLNGTLPPAPVGTWWWYGISDELETIRKRS